MSERKDAVAWVLIALGLILAATAAFYTLQPELEPHTTLHIGDGIYTARIAKDSADMTTLQSDTTQLSDGQALIFAYGTDGLYAVQTDTLQSPADLIWLSSQRIVEYIVKGASSNDSAAQYMSPHPARYIVEVPAGDVDKKAISIGSTATFNDTVGGNI